MPKIVRALIVLPPILVLVPLIFSRLLYCLYFDLEPGDDQVGWTFAERTAFKLIDWGFVTK